MSNVNNLTKLHLKPYINEIITNAKWAISLIEQGEKSIGIDFEKIKYYSLAISTSSAIIQLAYVNVANRSPEKERANERLMLFETYYPNKPSPPTGLREIRNDTQHFDERMDRWLFSLIDNGVNGFAYIQDGEKNIELYSTNSEESFEKRMINTDVLKYWNHTVNIKELKEWCKAVLLHFTEEK